MRRLQSRFGSLLKKLREERSMSLRDLEAATGVSNGYLSQIESGKVAPPSPKILQRLSTALQSPYESLMEAAGYLEPALRSEPVLRLGRRMVSLSDFSEDEKKDLLGFIEILRNRRREAR